MEAKFSFLLFTELSVEQVLLYMQNIGLLLVMMLIPVVIFMFSFEKEQTFKWDKVVIIDKVIEAKSLLLALGCIFLSVLFWRSNCWFLEIVLFSFFLIGVVHLIKILINSYRWIRVVEVEGYHENYRNKLRNKYLFENRDNNNEIKKIWDLTWRVNIGNLIDERNFIKVFLDTLDKLIKDGKFTNVCNLLRPFLWHLNKRSFYDWRIFEDFFNKLLEWHYVVFQFSKDKKKKAAVVTQISLLINDLIRKIVVLTLKNNTAYTFFEVIKKHIKDKEVDYLRNFFFLNICNTFFENVVESEESYEVWSAYFPNEWMVTLKNLRNPENIISRIWRDKFFNWALSRFSNNNEDSDKKLESISRELFPEVEPIKWSAILHLLLTPWNNDNRLKSAIERKRRFGAMGRIHIVEWGPEVDLSNARKEREIETKDTIELSLAIFEHEFTQEKLEKYLEELKQLESNYKEKTTEESARKKYIYIFERMLKVLSEKAKS